MRTIMPILALSVFCFAVASAFDLPVQQPIGPFPLSVSAEELDVNFTAWNAAHEVGNATVSGRYQHLLLLRNSGVAAATFTLSSQPAPETNRLGDISDYSLGAGEYAAFLYGRGAGWATTAVQIISSSTDVEGALLQL